MASEQKDWWGQWSPAAEEAKPSLTAAQIHALSSLGGNAPRVWFGRDNEGQKARWLARARRAWLNDVARWSKNSKSEGPVKPGTLAKVLAEAINHEGKFDWGSLASDSSRLFGRDLKTAIGLLEIVTGCQVEDATQLAFGKTWLENHAIKASKARRGRALAKAHAEYEKASANAWRPRKVQSAGALVLGKTASLKELDKEAKYFLNRFGFGKLSVNGAIPKDVALGLIKEASQCMRFISEFTGLGDRTMGLGGWSLELGVGAVAQSGLGVAGIGANCAAECNPGERSLKMGCVDGNFALAHEWFHAYDASLALWSGDPNSYVSEGVGEAFALTALAGKARLATGELLSSLLIDQRKWSNLPKKKAVPADALVVNGFLAAAGLPKKIKKKELDSVRSKTCDLAKKLVMVTSAKAFLDQKKEIAKWQSECQGIMPEAKWENRFIDQAHARTLVLRLHSRSVKRQIGLLARRPSDFASSCVIDDVMRKKISGMSRYYTLPTEILARGFEASIQQHACHEFNTRAPVEMVSDILCGGPSAPKGAELEKAMDAYKRYFLKTKKMAIGVIEKMGWSERA